MPPPVALAAAMIGLSAAQSGMQIAQGISYRRQAKKYAKTKRPKYEIPQSLKDYVSATKFEAGRYGVAGQGQIEARMARQMAGAQRAIQQSGQSSASQLAAISSLNQQGMEQQAELGIAGEQARTGRLRDLYGAQRIMGQQEQAQWQWDEQPYLDAMHTAAELERGGTQMLMQGAQGLAQTGMSAIGAFGGGKTGDVTAAGGATEPLPDTGAAAASTNRIMGGKVPYMDIGYEAEEGFNLPTQLTNQMNSELYGTEVDDELSDYYGLDKSFNRLAGLYRRRGSERSREKTRTY